MEGKIEGAQNENNVPPFVLSIDPGRDKCGAALVKCDGEIQWHRVIAAAQMRESLEELSQQFSFTHLVLGDSTSSREWRAKIQNWLPQITIILQDERGSTLEARPLYWQHNPPRGWRRLVPLSLQNPPEAIDDFAAAILARRFYANASTRGFESC